MPSKSANVKNETQYEGLKKKGMSKERAAKIANSPGASSRGGKSSGSGNPRSSSKQGGTSARRRPLGAREARRARGRADYDTRGAMTVTDQLIENSKRYTEGFDKGDLPMPPGKKVAVVACMDARLIPTRVL